MILLIALLMAIAGYRMFGTSPAEAAPKIENAPAKSEPQRPAIEAGEGTPSDVAPAPAITGPDVPPAPPSRRQAVPPQADDRAKAFIPPSVTAPRAAMSQDLTESLPDVGAIDVKAVPVASPKPVAMPKQEEKGSRVGKVAKSVGKIFGFGRKETPAPAK
jgi:hypothetical protein